MIIWLCGASASGKSTIVRGVFDSLGEVTLYRSISDDYNIRCYHNKDILTVGRKFGYVSAGLDGVKLGTQKFKKFIKKEYSNWRHIILEGNKFVTNREMHDFLLEGDYNFKLYYICPPIEKMLERASKRNNGVDKKFVFDAETPHQYKQHENYESIFSEEKYNKNVIRKQNLDLDESKQIIEEILCIIKE